LKPQNLISGLPSERGGSQLRSTALALIPVGVVVERRKAKSVWADFLWRPVSVFVGKPVAAPWTPLDTRANTTLFFAGEAVPMPPDIVEVLAIFVAQHHVERPFVKRQRDQKAPSDQKVGREKEE
jgi:hypothetical protein